MGEERRERMGMGIGEGKQENEPDLSLAHFYGYSRLEFYDVAAVNQPDTSNSALTVPVPPPFSMFT